MPAGVPGTFAGCGFDTCILVGVGDVDRDGYADLAAGEHADDILYLYPDTGTTLHNPVRAADGSAVEPPCSKKALRP
jgi:hypothetical protein